MSTLNAPPIVLFVDANLRREEIPVSHIEGQIPGRVVKVYFTRDDPEIDETKSDRELISYFNGELEKLNQEKEEQVHGFFITCDEYIHVQSWYTNQEVDLSDNFHLVVISLSRRIWQQKTSKWNKKELKASEVSLVRDKVSKKVISKCRKVLK